MTINAASTEEVAEAKRIIATWRPVEGIKLACVRCNTQDVRVDPADRRRFGCPGCGLNTQSVSLCFREVA